MSFLDFDFEYRHGSLHTRDYQLAPLLRTTTTRLNQRLKRRQKQTLSHWAKMILQRSGAGGRVKPCILYSLKMIGNLGWKERITPENRKSYPAIRMLLATAEEPSRPDGMRRLLGAYRSNSSYCYKEYIECQRSFRDDKEGSFRLPHGAIIWKYSIPVALQLDRVTLTFSCEVSMDMRQGLIDDLHYLFASKGFRKYWRHRDNVMVSTRNPSSELISFSSSSMIFRLDWNPAKFPMEQALSPLHCLLMAIEHAKGSVSDFRLSRLDIAIDYPCPVGLPLLLDLSAKPKYCREPRLQGTPPFQTVCYGRGEKTLKIYNKFAELAARGHLKRQKGAWHLPGDVFRFEAQLRHKAARNCLNLNPLKGCPFPKIRFEDGTTIPHPEEIYSEWFPEVFTRFSHELFAALEKASDWKIRCGGILDSIISLKDGDEQPPNHCALIQRQAQ